MNKTVMKVFIQVFWWTFIFISLGLIPESEIALLYGRFTLTFIRNFQIVSQKGHPIAHSHQQSMRVLVTSHTLQNSVLLVILILDILVGMQRDLTVF